MAYFECPSYDSTVLSLPTPSEASGAIARFNTDLTENLLSAVAEFSASQASGTPTPSTPIPIVGVDKVNVTRCGKNLFDKSKMVISTQRFVKYGVDAYNDTLPNGEFNLQANQAYTFTFSGENSTNFESFGVYNEEGTRVAIVYNNKKATFTPASTGAYFLAFAVSAGNWGGTWDNYDIQLEFGSTATDYEPYQGTTALINLGGTYYGGSVDAVTGKITLTWKRDDLTQLTWSRVSSGVENTYFMATLSSGYKYLANQSNFLCSHYEKKSIGSTGSSEGIYLTNSNTVRIRDNNYTTASDFKNSLTNVELVYELATPIVVYASNTAEIPTIVGDNQVFADTGDVALKYFETIKSALY